VLNFFRVVPKKRKVRVNKSKGLIFSNPNRNRKIVFYVANILFLAALIYGGYLYTPVISAFYKYRFTKAEVKEEKIVEQNIQKKASNEYIIQIPKILAYSNVIENVSPFDQVEYQRILKTNVVVQARDTDKPGSGKGKMVYIFAHSSSREIDKVRSNAVFYLLGELQNDDLVFLSYHGQQLKYRVYDKKIIKPSELEYLSYQDQSREVLILQTCWPIGTDWNRLIVMAEAIL